MVEGLLVLLCCQAVGTVLASALHLTIPGPVLGMLILLVILFIRRPSPASGVMRAGERVLDELPLLFIPAGVGLVACLGLIARQWLPIIAGLVLAWAAGLVATALAARLATRLVHTPDVLSLAVQAPDLVADVERMDGTNPDDGLAD